MSGFNYKSRIERTHVDGLAHIHEGAKAFQIHQTSNKKSSSTYNKFAKKAVNVILALILTFAFAPIFTPNFKGLQAEADGELTFGDVSIEEGARVALAGNKSFTVASSGSSQIKDAIADQNSALSVTSANVDASVNSFLSTNYSSDLLSSSLSNARNMSIYDVKNKQQLIKGSLNSYWLSDTGSNGMFTYRAYSTANGIYENKRLSVSGEFNGKVYEDEMIVKGPYDWTCNFNFRDKFVGFSLSDTGFIFKNFTCISKNMVGHDPVDGEPLIVKPNHDEDDGCAPYVRQFNGFRYDLNKGETLYADLDQWYQPEIENGFCNNYIGPSKTLDIPGGWYPGCHHFKCKYKTMHYMQRLQYKTTVKKNCQAIVVAKKLNNDRPDWGDGAKFYPVKYGDVLLPGDTVMVMVDNGDMKKTKGFMSDQRFSESGNTYYGTFDGKRRCAIVRVVQPQALTTQRGQVYAPLGFYQSKDYTIKGTKVSEGSHSIRPMFNFDISKVAQWRQNVDVDTYVDGNLKVNKLTQSALNGRTYKAVLCDENLSIGGDVSASSIETDRGKAVIVGNTIKIPYGAKTLKFKNLQTSGGNYISALSKNDATTKYGIVGQTNSAIINLTSVLNNKVVGSTADIALFAEKINGVGESDFVSTGSLAFNLEVVHGDPHTLTYDANGGIGSNLPSSMQVKAGSTVVLANGSMLSQSGNVFSKWVVCYTNEAGDSVNIVANSAQAIVMPDSDVVVRASYSGVQIAKSTETQGQTNYIITWNLNGGTLDGYTGSSIMTVVRKGAKLISPGEPVKGDEKFYGWYTSAEGGSKVDLNNKTASSNLTLYAHYSKYDLPTDYGGGDVFLAPKSVNPYDVIKGKNSDAISLGTVKSAASQLSNGINLAPEILNAKNDEWHLFAKISGDGSNANDWLECRIIHTGQHDGDGSGLTFQAVHALPERHQWDTNYSGDGKVNNWKVCTLRSTMNGSIFNSLPSALQSIILPIKKKYNTTIGKNPNGGSSATVTDKLWVASFTEIVNDVKTKASSWWNDNSHQGATYAFWEKTDIELNKYAYNIDKQVYELLKTLMSNRSGKVLTIFGLTRSLSPGGKPNSAYIVSVGINMNDGFGYSTSLSLDVVNPCFAL